VQSYLLPPCFILVLLLSANLCVHRSSEWKSQHFSDNKLIKNGLLLTKWVISYFQMCLVFLFRGVKHNKKGLRYFSSDMFHVLKRKSNKLNITILNFYCSVHNLSQAPKSKVWKTLRANLHFKNNKYMINLRSKVMPIETYLKNYI
jgi:hypothetical protein